MPKNTAQIIAIAEIAAVIVAAAAACSSGETGDGKRATTSGAGTTTTSGSAGSNASGPSTGSSTTGATTTVGGSGPTTGTTVTTGGGASGTTSGQGGSNTGSGGRGGSSAGGAAGRGGAGGAVGSGGSGSSDAGVVTCTTTADPLKTSIARVDAYDCLLVELAKMYAHPDPMMIKSQVQQESSFNVLATSADSPCGVRAGWTDAESKSFGLIQVTPACGEATSALLPNGHPNLTTDMQSALWATSVFNPNLNLGEGYNTITMMLRSLKSKYAGCTDADYVLMSAGAFNSGTGAILGCNMFNARAQAYVTAVLGHYHGFARSAGWPDPYP